MVQSKRRGSLKLSFEEDSGLHLPFYETQGRKRNSTDSEAMINPELGEPAQALRIFVVENHADTLKYLSLYLEATGHTVVSAKTMAQALEALPNAGCDVLISDIGLPDGDGWELLRTVQLPRPIYAIAMSGFGMNADHVRSKDAGYRHHLLKPFVPSELDVVLAEAAKEAVDRSKMPTKMFVQGPGPS